MLHADALAYLSRVWTWDKCEKHLHYPMVTRHVYHRFLSREDAEGLAFHRWLYA